MTENDGLVRFGPVHMTTELYVDLPKHQQVKAFVSVFLSRAIGINSQSKEHQNDR